MKSQHINAFDTIIKVRGRVFSNDGRRRIDLKGAIKDILESSEISENSYYVMELCLSRQKLLNRVQELLDNNVVPIFFYFAKEDAKGAEHDLS